MPDDFQRIRPGKARVSARAWNGAMDAAEDFKKHKHGGGAGDDRPFERSRTIVTIQNNSGDAVKRFGVLGIDGAIFPPSDNTSQFQNQVCLVGVTPSADHAGKYVILLEPAADQAVVRGVVAGAVAVRVDFQDAADQFADAKPGTSDTLISGSGNARILYKEGGDDIGTWWAYVNVGGSGGGGLVPGTKQGQNPQMLTDNAIGWGYIQLVPEP